VRAAGSADLPRVAALRWAWGTEGNGASDTLPREMFVDAFLRWAQQNDDSHRCLVAERGHELVGMAWLALTSRVPSPRRVDRWTGDLQSVYVVPAHRSAGVGAALIEAARAHAAALGVERLVVHSSERAVRFYERAGFMDSELLRHRRP